jgi:hypothetical protein
MCASMAVVDRPSEHLKAERGAFDCAEEQSTASLLCCFGSGSTGSAELIFWFFWAFCPIPRLEFTTVLMIRSLAQLSVNVAVQTENIWKGRVSLLRPSVKLTSPI